MLVCFGHGASAADLTLKDGKTYEDCKVSCFTHDAAGNGVLNVALPDEENGGYTQEYALPVASVKEVNLAEDGGTGALGDIITKTGQTYPPMLIVSGEDHPVHGFFFNVIEDLTNTATTPLRVPAAQLTSIQLSSEPAYSSANDYRSSSYRSYGSSRDDDDDDDYSSSAFDDDEDSGFSSGGLMFFAGIGLAAILGGLLVFFIANTLVNSGLIWCVCKFWDVAQIRYKQCFYCALYLGILPIILLPLLFIPWIGLWAYLMCLAAGSRAIVMGSLEVLEGTAWVVSAGFGLSSWLLGRFIKEFAGQIG